MPHDPRPALGRLPLLAALLLASCQPGPAHDGPMPLRLSETGYRAALQDPDAAYDPSFPLWTNGSDKQRFVLSPSGERPHPADGGAEGFEPGTLFFKTFSYAGQPVETRVIRLGETVEYYVYLWNENGSEAELVEEDRPIAVPVEGLEHVVPAARQCTTCHDVGAGPVLGYTRAQLEGDLEPHEGETRWVAGYLLGNCTHCHNGSGRPGSAFDLRPDAFLESTVGRATQGSAAPAGVRIAPGEPEESVLYRALRRDRPDTAPMPPLGVQRVDDAAVERVGAWIEGLPGET